MREAILKTEKNNIKVLIRLFKYQLIFQ